MAHEGLDERSSALFDDELLPSEWWREGVDWQQLRRGWECYALIGAVLRGEEISLPNDRFIEGVLQRLAEEQPERGQALLPTTGGERAPLAQNDPEWGMGVAAAVVAVVGAVLIAGGTAAPSMRMAALGGVSAPELLQTARGKVGIPLARGEGRIALERQVPSAVRRYRGEEGGEIGGGEQERVRAVGYWPMRRY
ncbi:MAG: RseA family anti-sigma factor [Hydrogenophilus sp.]|nr:RseA family anti-sigma factor [Hydrogenophilus sp.]